MHRYRPKYIETIAVLTRVLPIDIESNISNDHFRGVTRRHGGIRRSDGQDAVGEYLEDRYSQTSILIGGPLQFTVLSDFETIDFQFRCVCYTST